MTKFISIISVFLGAFLVFQIQPILGKLILPRYGGSASVWIACMMFFQSILFAGYCYALLMGYCRNIRKQLVIHVLLLILALFSVFDIGSLDVHISHSVLPGLAVFSILWKQIGIPYLVLSGSGVLLQRWCQLALDSNKDFAKKWFAWSNTGALLSLISYPFVVEPLLSLPQQIMLWQAGFLLVFSIQIVLLHCSYLRVKNLSQHKPRLFKGFSISWIFYPMLGVMVLMSTSYMLTQNVPPMPFLWILPLFLYLVTFVLCFSNMHLYQRHYFLPLILFSLLAAMLMFFCGTMFSAAAQASMYSLILFVACFVCHGELSLIAPEQNTDHSLYYWSISLGGCLGGIIVSLAAPALFNQILEYPLAFFLVTAAVMWRHLASKRTHPWFYFASASAFAILVAIFLSFFYLNDLLLRNEVVAYRNFYGSVSIRDLPQQDGVERRLIDGSTVHGMELRDNAGNSYLREDTVRQHYYAQQSGIQLAFDYVQQFSSANISVVGLGAGVLASFARENDDLIFYEINPAVIKLANSHFSYLDQSPASIQVIEGDARMQLQQQLTRTVKQRDLMIIDAFTSDVIPVHLLTQEAFDLYEQHIKYDGILAVHISNTHLDLAKVIENHAHKLGFEAALSHLPPKGDNFGADWMLIAKSSVMAQLESLAGQLNIDFQVDSADEISPIVWTDQHHSILTLLKEG